MRFSDVKNYRYTLPKELIRREGVEPRDSAQLFVYDTKSDTVTFDIFRNLAHYLPEQALVVLNNTRVLPARLWLHKENGGKIEVLVLVNQIENQERIPVLVDRKTAVGQKLFFSNNDNFEIVGQEENIFFVALHSAKHSLEMLLETFGETPLPHYLEGGVMTEEVLRKRYQTVFAQSGASVAAPTASLHFTDEVFHSLEKKGVETTTLTLNVGLGTFAPLREENFTTKKLHKEFVTLSVETAEMIYRARKSGRKIVAVGTTTLRTLEALCERGQVKPYDGLVDIFISPPYDFQMVDMLMTNFHLPESSLMLLVDAFLQHKQAKRNIIDLYKIAMENKFAFYSFGDSMLIL